MSQKGVFVAFVFIFRFVSSFDLNFELLFLQRTFLLLRLFLKTLAEFCFACFNLFENKLKVSRFNFSIGPGLISLLHLAPLQ